MANPISETDICNQALARLGQTQIIDIGDDTPSGGACRSLYYQARDSLLQEFPWNFAITQQALTQLEESPLSQWEFYYQIPADCLRILSLNDVDFWSTTNVGDFVVEGDKLAANWSSAVVRYIQRVEDTSLFTPLFVDALACKLAMRLSIPIKGSDSTTQLLAEELEKLTGPKARRVNAFEGRPQTRLPFQDSYLVRSRRGYGCGSGIYRDFTY